MEKNELVSLTISALALLVSLITLFLTQFFKRNSLVGVIASWNTGAEISEEFQICDVTLSNTGNRELLVRDIELLCSPEKGDETFPVVEHTNIPVVIKPGEVKLLKINVPNYYLKFLSSRKQKLKFLFHIYSNDVTLYVCEKTLSFPYKNNEPTKEDWKPFKMFKAKS